MDQKEILKERIEKERAELNRRIGCSTQEEIYSQSALLDRLIAEYTELTDAEGAGSAD